jgi:hypothetical protein
MIQHADYFEVRSEGGSIVRRFAFDDNARRRAISGRMTGETSFPSRQDLCRQELYGRNGETVDLSRCSFVRRAEQGASISGPTGTGNCPDGALGANRGWKRSFQDPIPLPRRRQLVTLEDAGKHITKLARAEHEA